MKKLGLIAGLALPLMAAVAHAHNFCTTHAAVAFVQNETGTICHSNGTLAWACPVPGGPNGQAFLIWGQGPSSPSSNHGVYLLQIAYGVGAPTVNLQQITCDCNGDPTICRISKNF